MDRISKRADALAEIVQVGHEMGDDERRGSWQAEMHFETELMERFLLGMWSSGRSLSMDPGEHALEQPAHGEDNERRIRTKIPRPHSLCKGCMRHTVACSKSRWSR